jgi:predicted DNA-binding transcriptional regulator AlpA
LVLNVGERTVWRLSSMAAAGGSAFPRPVRIGGQVIRWRWRDVEKYLEELAGK